MKSRSEWAVAIEMLDLGVNAGRQSNRTRVVHYERGDVFYPGRFSPSGPRPECCFHDHEMGTARPETICRGRFCSRVVIDRGLAVDKKSHQKIKTRLYLYI